MPGLWSSGDEKLNAGQALYQLGYTPAQLLVLIDTGFLYSEASNHVCVFSNPLGKDPITETK